MSKQNSKNKTLAEKVVNAIKLGKRASVQAGRNGFVHLNEIYKRCGLEKDDKGQTAAVRGILNRNCLDADSIFERPADGQKFKVGKKEGVNKGLYRLRGDEQPQTEAA